MESTPIGREGSKKIGQRAARAIAGLNPSPGYPIDVPQRYAQDDIRAAAKKEGGQAVRTGRLKVRLQRRKDQPHRDYERAKRAGVAGPEVVAAFKYGEAWPPKG